MIIKACDAECLDGIIAVEKAFIEKGRKKVARAGGLENRQPTMARQTVLSEKTAANTMHAQPGRAVQAR